MEEGWEEVGERERKRYRGGQRVRRTWEMHLTRKTSICFLWLRKTLALCIQQANSTKNKTPYCAYFFRWTKEWSKSAHKVHHEKHDQEQTKKKCPKKKSEKGIEVKNAEKWINK